MSAHASQAFSITHCTDSEDLPQGRPVDLECVFGGVELETDKFIMRQVHNNHDATTLERVIQDNILPGMRIWSISSIPARQDTATSQT